MVKVNDKDYYMDGYLKKNLDLIKDKVCNDEWDWVFIIDGVERGGKSHLAQQIAYYLDPGFDTSRIVFTPEEFVNAVVNAKKNQAIIFDEALRGLSARSAISQINRAIVRMMAEMGQKNLFIFIVLPSFFDLDRITALHRARTLIHVYTDNRMNRGRFLFFNANKKKRLYLLGKKTYNYNVIESNFFGTYKENYVIDKKLYEKLKLNALKNLGATEAPKASYAQKLEKQRLMAINYMKNTLKLKLKPIGEAFGLDRSTIGRLYKDV